MTEYPQGSALIGSIPGIDAAELVLTGGQKAVYKARAGDLVFALKLIDVALEQSSDAEQGDNETEEDTDVSAVMLRAQREVNILERVDVSVLTRRGPLELATVVVEGKQWLYFTEEWIEGDNLHDILKRGPLSEEQVARLGIDLVQAVDWLAEHDLIHRDIKPANIMWANDRSRFVLLDPGIALDLNAPSLTRTAALVGTMAYLSPEQMDTSQKRNLDFRSDLFAIGIVMYEAASGAHPFASPGNSLSSVLAGILNSTPQSLANRLEAFSQELSDFIDRLLAKTPHLRYRTRGRALAAIDAVGAALGVVR